MEKQTEPKVTELAIGAELIAKQMQAEAGDLLPKHLANLESIIYVNEGACILHINDEDKHLKVGDAFVIPPEIIHQIKAITDFKAVHFMPKGIKFKFFK